MSSSPRDDGANDGQTSGVVATSARTPIAVVGRYALYGEIAVGGMATVHLGRLLGAAGFARTIALKRMHRHLVRDRDFATMFLDEARIAARIQHPNVVATLDVVEMADELLLVMEYVDGESLSRLIRRAGERGEGVSVDVAVAIVTNALHGLHAAHEATTEDGAPLGIVHRDVSPQNVLVGRDGVARVLDFGVAKASSNLQVTREGNLKGKMSYMAPEQLRRQVVDRRGDVYAMAVVLWETLTSRRLFHADNEAAIVEKVLVHVVPPPSRVAPGISADLDAIVLRGLARDPADRFATAREMALALERAITPALPSKVSEWVQRVAADRLAERQARVAAIESGPRLPGADSEPSAALSESLPIPLSRSADVTPTPKPSAPTIWRSVAIALVVVVGALVAMLVVATLRPERALEAFPTTTMMPSVAVPSAPVPVVATMPPPTQLAEPVTTAAITAASTQGVKHTGVKATRPAPSVAVTTTTSPSASAPDCTVPFTWDGGIRSYRRECLPR